MSVSTVVTLPGKGLTEAMDSEVTSAQVDGGDLADFLRNALLRASPLPFPKDPEYHSYISEFTLRFRLETRRQSFSLSALLDSRLIHMLGDSNTKEFRPYTQTIRRET